MKIVAKEIYAIAGAISILLCGQGCNSKPQNQALRARNQTQDVEFLIEAINKDRYNVILAYIRSGRPLQSDSSQVVDSGNPERFIYWPQQPLIAAIEHYRPDVAVLLLKSGASPKITGSQGRTPLHAAAEFGYSRIVHQLIDKDADINALDSESKTPLDIYFGSQQGAYADTMIELIGHGARCKKPQWRRDRHVIQITSDQDTLSLALRESLRDRHLADSKWLLDHGADPNRIFNDTTDSLLAEFIRDSSPITEQRDLKFVELLLKYQSDPNRVGLPPHDFLPVRIQNVNGKKYVEVESLENAGARAPNTDKNTPLHLACKNHLTSIAAVLLKSGANPNAKNGEGKTPLDLVEEPMELRK